MKSLWLKLTSLGTPEETLSSTSREHQLDDLVGRNGKVNIDRLRRLVASIDETSFCELFKCPFLIGAGVYEGTIESFPENGRWRRLSATRVFFRNQLRELLEGSSLESAVFILRKNLSHRALSPQYVELLIGRDPASDIRIPDPTISRLHAKVSITPMGFTLHDCGARNAIVVNAGRIAKLRKLEFNDKIKLGRFEFRFVEAAELYRRLKLQNHSCG